MITIKDLDASDCLHLILLADMWNVYELKSEIYDGTKFDGETFQALVAAAIESCGGYKTLFLDYCGKLLADNKDHVEQLTVVQTEHVVRAIVEKNRKQGFPMARSLELILYVAVNYPASTCLVSLALETFGPQFTDLSGQYLHITENYDIIFQYLSRMTKYVFSQTTFTCSEDLWMRLLRNFCRVSGNSQKIEDLCSIVINHVLSSLGPINLKTPLVLPSFWSYTSVQIRKFIYTTRLTRSYVDMSIIEGYVSSEMESEQIFSSCDVLVVLRNFLPHNAIIEKIPRIIMYILQKYVSINYEVLSIALEKPEVDLEKVYEELLSGHPYFLVMEDGMDNSEFMKRVLKFEYMVELLRAMRESKEMKRSGKKKFIKTCK